jgi:low temperature requirement protein LtrA
MVAAGFTANLLRPSEANRVSFIELFFDLTFVFAVTQVSHVLIEHTDVTALVHTLILHSAVWWVWINTTWAINWLNPESGWVRGLLIALMLLGLLMSTAIPEAFESRAMLFACAIAVLDIGRSVFTMLAFAKHRPDHALDYLRISVWHVASGVLWLSGAFASSDAQIWLWAAAILSYCVGPIAGFRVPMLGRSDFGGWDVSGEHLAERVGLFYILVLGEIVVVTGASFSTGTIDTSHTLAFLAAFTGSVLMWLVYFNHSARGGKEYISHAEQSGRVARYAYTYVPLVMVLGVVFAAVAYGLLLEEPSSASNIWTAGMSCASFAIYLFGNILFRRAVGGGQVTSHIIGIVALSVLFVLHPMVSVLTLGWLVNLIVLVVVVADEVTWRKRPLPGAHRAEKRVA